MLRILLLTISFINLTVVFGTLELVIGFNKTQNLLKLILKQYQDFKK